MRLLTTSKNFESYSNALAKMYNWNYTTVVRTHYPMKPHIADKKIEQLVKTGCVSNIFYSIEPDREIEDVYTSAISVNHLHLLMDVKGVIVDSNVFRKKIANAMGLNPKAVLNIEPIRGEKNIARYVTKHITLPGSHHNYFVTL